MKSLPTLIKLAQRNIDAIAVEISKAQARIEGLRMAKAAAQAKGEAEQAMAIDDNLDLQLLASVPAYLYRLKGEQGRFDMEIAELEAGIAHVRARLVIAYQEKSKLESLQTQYQSKIDKEFAMREQAQLDEAALTRRA